MKRSVLLFVLSVLPPALAIGQAGQWKLAGKDPCSAVIIGPAGGALSGAYRITNDGDTNVNLYLSKCAQACSAADEKKEKCCPDKDQIAGQCCPLGSDKVTCANQSIVKCPYIPAKNPPKDVLVLRAHNSVDVFVSSCLKIEEIDEDNDRAGTHGTYENLSHLSAP